MRKDKYIRVSTVMAVVLTGGCGECKLRKSEYCEGCRTQTILDLLDDVAKTGGVEIPQRHGRLIDADALIANHFSDEHRIAMSYADKCWMRRIINGEQTVIPADPEGGADG